MSDIPKSIEIRSPVRVSGFPLNNNEVFDMLFNVKSSPKSKGDQFSSSEPEMARSEGASLSSSINNDVTLFQVESSPKSEENSKFSLSESQMLEVSVSDGAPMDSKAMIQELLLQLVEETLSLAPLTEVSMPAAPGVHQMISSLDNCPTISTPEDLPRLKARPAQPSKCLPSPAPADPQLAKRSLFDSPAPSRPSAAEGPANFSRAGFSNYRSASLLPDVDTPVKVMSFTPKSLKPALSCEADTPGKATSDTPKSVKFSEKSPERISPKPFVETHTATDVEFLLMKIRSMSVVEEAKAPEPEMELSFALPSRLELPNLSMDVSDVYDVQGDLLPLTSDGDGSVLASHGGDIAFRPPSLASTFSMESSMKANVLATLALQHEAQLLEKDREIAALQKDLLGRKAEAAMVVSDIKKVEERMAPMGQIIAEFDGTIKQMQDEAEKEMAVLQQSSETVSKECRIAQDDLQAVERSLKDITSRYSRTRESIPLLQAREEEGKAEAAKLQEILRKDQERYEVLKSDANEKLVTANTRLEEVKKAGEAKILKLRALLKKEEMRVKSLEVEVDKKEKESQELTQMCDELISKV